MYQPFGKRLFDLVICLSASVLLLPLMGLVALLVLVFLDGPVLFRQQRPGLNGRLFTIYKFRTMTDERDANGRLLPDEQRLTPFGRFLRATSLDELPELLNVLRGDMSLVGPRPLLPGYLDLYTPEQMRRHAVKPGITGWAQINGRNATSWEARFDHDLWYVDHCSWALDCLILWQTMRQVAQQEGISQPGHATMQPFTGSQI
ncbi:MAG: sugar transferase [Chloroflexota bacterium]